MKRKLILHIGAHRTATTALQNYLLANFHNVQREGFFYPYKIARHQKLMGKLFHGVRKPESVAEDLNARADKREHAIHSIILSDEDICMRRDLSILSQFRQWFDVKIVFTLRRQDTWLESWFFQNIKWQWNTHLSHCTFEEFLGKRKEFHWIQYNRYLKRMEKLFGKENIILNIHEKAQMAGGPIDTFCDSIGLLNHEGFHASTHVNESFSPTISEFMRCLPLDQAPEPYRDILVKALAKINNRLSDGQSRQSERLMSFDQRAALMAEYDRENRAVAQRYFGRNELFLEPLPSKDTSLASMQLPTDSYVLMQDLVAPLLQEIIKHRILEAKK